MNAINNHSIKHLDARLQQAALDFPFPPTPSLAHSPHLGLKDVRGNIERRRSSQRRLAWGAMLAVLALLGGLLSVPRVRAAVAEFIQIGAVRIFQRQPGELTPAPTVDSAPGTAPMGSPQAQISPSQIPTSAQPAPSDLGNLENLLGETSLGEARERVNFDIRLPAYPPDLGGPDRVFLQDLGGTMLVLVWTNPNLPQNSYLSLHIIAADSFALQKIAPTVVLETQVNRSPAVWAEGPYLLMLKNSEMSIMRLINGHVLIWEHEGQTYRLETDLSLGEAIKIAESLQ